MSSPVYEAGARNKVRIPLSISLPSGVTTEPYMAWRGGYERILRFPTGRNIFSITSHVPSPLILITATPPLPRGVDTAAITSFKNTFFTFSVYLSFAFRELKRWYLVMYLDFRLQSCERVQYFILLFYSTINFEKNKHSRQNFFRFIVRKYSFS